MNTNTNVEQTISNTLAQLDIPAHLLGYEYFREAIKLTMDDKSFVHSVTTRLYPEVAKRFNTSASKVERAMRWAIESAWEYSGSDAQALIFGCTISIHRGKPTNGQFIATVADYLITHGG